MKKEIFTGLTALVIGCAPPPKNTVDTMIKYDPIAHDILQNNGWDYFKSVDAFDKYSYDEFGVLRVEEKEEMITLEEALRPLPEFMKDNYHFILVPLNEDTLNLYIKPKRRSISFNEA